MRDAILQSLPIALGTLLASLPLSLIPLMLRTRRDGRALGSFLVGWTSGFLLVGSAVLLSADSIFAFVPGPSRWVEVVRVLLGMSLLGIALRRWRGRPRQGESADLPGWMRSLDTMSPGRAAVLGLLTTVYPKYAVLIASGSVAIATATRRVGAQLGALAVFAAVSSLAVFSPLLLSWMLGERAVAPMARFKAWVERYNAVIMAVVLSALGVVVLGSGTAGLW